MTITHPVDAFLASIGATLKILNPYYLNLAKTEIFNIVQKYEMQMITAHTSGHYSLHDEHQSDSLGTSRVSQYTNLTSVSAILNKQQDIIQIRLQESQL